MKINPKSLALASLAVTAIPVALLSTVRASDHADTPDIAANPGADLTDVYVFPSASNIHKICLAMNVHPLITNRMKTKVFFDPNVLYQF